MRVDIPNLNRTLGCDCTPAIVRRTVVGASSRRETKEMVRLAEPSLNQFIDVLAEWDSELKALNVPELNDPGMEP
ncbi:MAG: hypothetical protein JKY46_12150 [Robiginitomaculum sp.]|nr:hypothetical protein [Robiginitomaculum sp.]